LAAVRAAMGVVQTEGGGVGDFSSAFAALTPLSLDDLIAVIRDLARTHEAEVLAGHLGEAPTGDQPRLRAALHAAILLEAPAADLTPESVSDAASALQSADPALRDQILRALVSARYGAQMVATTMEGLAMLMAAANAPQLNPALAGVRGPVSPGPWAPPGNQPIPFYLGTAAHLAIAAEYTLMHPGEIVRTNTVSITRILDALAGPPFNLAPNRGGLTGDRLASEPDICNLTLHHLYEIKPAGSETLARTEAQWYVRSFTLAGVPMTLGPSGAPGTSGAVPAPGGVYLFSSPEPGVIVYQLRRMQVERVTVPEAERARLRLPEFRLAPLTQQQQQQVVATMTLGTMALILLAILLSPVGV
jgi:hypothetical protein